MLEFCTVNSTAFASDEPELINGAYQIESAEDGLVCRKSKRW